MCIILPLEGFNSPPTPSPIGEIPERYKSTMAKIKRQEEITPSSTPPKGDYTFTLTRFAEKVKDTGYGPKNRFFFIFRCDEQRVERSVNVKVGKETKKQISVSFEPVHDANGIPYTMLKQTNDAYGNSQAGLTIFLNSLLGQDVAEAFMEESGDTDAMIGLKAHGRVTYTKSGDKEYANFDTLYADEEWLKEWIESGYQPTLELVSPDATDDTDPFEGE